MTTTVVKSALQAIRERGLRTFLRELKDDGFTFHDSGALDCKGLAWPGTAELSLEESGTARGFFCWAGPLSRSGSGGIWTVIQKKN
ncbi:hypothetical protein V6N13_003405 [Hibiscus sabdariffa]